jgi:hypothetical protein
MRLALPPQLMPTKIGTVRRRSPGRRESAPRMRGIVTAKGTANVTRRERGSVTVKTARRAEAGARGRDITSAVAHLPHQATRDAIMVARVYRDPREIIRSTSTKPILLVNNGQKMPPKLKIHLKTISLPHLG